VAGWFLKHGPQFVCPNVGPIQVLTVEHLLSGWSFRINARVRLDVYGQVVDCLFQEQLIFQRECGGSSLMEGRASSRLGIFLDEQPMQRNGHSLIGDFIEHRGWSEAGFSPKAREEVEAPGLG
jgi:hypothetical protein